MWLADRHLGKYAGAAWRRIRASRRLLAAQLENARLLYQAELAGDYFQIQGFDASHQLLDATVKSYERNVQLTQDRFDGGVASQGDVALAQTQLETARVELADLGVGRAHNSNMPSRC